ncbi:sushi, von Willebrand factor type A, EGF and pentraxin domain-containing protein 1-like isoform X3 [Pocillopora verrucosa]|uniref:sushi, von Willebrand factor type A, EGF and pentraxin domain-containing protein 1-like isoform X3 n=1 Tax=Pocillopora verrucosa TaxID=203993 RepID=UPI0033402560
MEPLLIDEDQQQKTKRGRGTAAHGKIACLLTMAVLLALLLIFITLSVSGRRLCGAQKEKMDSMYKAFEALSKRLDSLDVNIGRKLDLVNVHVKNASQRTTALEMQDNQDSMFKAIEALSKRFDSLDANIERKLDLVNVNVKNMSERTTALEMNVRKICPLLKNLKNGFSLSQKNCTGESISFSCNCGYWLNGPSERLYLVNGSWTGVQPTCEFISPNYSLLFPYKSKNDYVIITHRMPSLTAVTVCMWIKTNATGNRGTLLSYAVSGEDNELLLLRPRDFVFSLRSVWSSPTNVSANDGKWHHICFAWENTAGSWKLFKDGSLGASGRGLAKGRLIRGGGHLVLGQDQDKLGGGFEEYQSFIGEMADVNIWNHVISDQEIRRMSKSCLTGTGNLFQWSDFKYHRMGSVQIVQPSCLN